MCHSKHVCRCIAEIATQCGKAISPAKDRSPVPRKQSPVSLCLHSVLWTSLHLHGLAEPCRSNSEQHGSLRRLLVGCCPWMASAAKQVRPAGPCDAGAPLVCIAPQPPLPLVHGSIRDANCMCSSMSWRELSQRPTLHAAGMHASLQRRQAAWAHAARLACCQVI